MTNGILKTITGPMYAGKTSIMLQDILWLNHCNHNVLVIKPKIDNRYSNDSIATHDQMKFPCFNMDNWDTVNKNYNLSAYNFDTVFLDEVQFMDTDETITNVQKMLSNGVNVVAAGLNQDSRGKPFETTAMLMAISDKIELLQSNCTQCGVPATKTQRLLDQGGRIEVGSIGVYEPRCLSHWTPK